MSPAVISSPSAWTLRAKLVASVVALFTVIALLTGAATVLLSHNYLLGELDKSLTNQSARTFGGRVPQNGNGVNGDGDGGGRGGLPPGGGADVLHVEFLGTFTGTDPLTGVQENYVVTRSNISSSLNADQLTELYNAVSTQRTNGHPWNIDLGGDVGTYRVVVAQRTNGVVAVDGLPIGPVNQFVHRIALLTVGGVLVGLVLVAAGGTYLVRRNLEPLSRVAATAGRVAGLQLDSGDVTGFARVPERDTDPHTEVGQVGLALNHMLDNVEGALQSRQESETRVRQFVADASHELRTPLASIRGYAELSRREEDPVPAGVTHALDRVESEALRMSSLVDDLLLLARLDEGRPLERDEVDLTMLAVDAVSDAHAASPDHTWELDVPEEPITVTGDRVRLHQILANLLANARVHTPENTTVVTSLRREPEGVRLSVTDNGPGIPENLRRNVFERFSRGDDSRSRAAGSTGLGLSIVAAVAAAHGGRVQVDSVPGHTEFSLILPD
ncbi:MAG: ATP-binding protein [Nostocoides sp.]